MQFYILTLLALSILLQLVIFFQLYRRQAKRILGRFSIHSKKEATSIVKMLDAYNKLTAVKWYADMMLDGDFGSLHIAQIQFLHQMSLDCDIALKNLHDIAETAAVIHPSELKHAIKAVGKQKLKQESDL